MKPIQISTDRQLFLDDLLIAEAKGCARRLHSPERKEWAVTSDNPWEQHLTMDGQQFWDEDRYRMYYSCSAGEPDTGPAAPRTAALAESLDGIHWSKPSLGIVSYEGSTDNNLFWEEPGNGLAVFKDDNPAASPEMRYKAIARDGKPMKNLLALGSPDGIHWELISEQYIFEDDGWFDSHNIAFWDSWREEYVIYARCGSNIDGTGSFQGGVRWVRRSTSKDFLNWTPWEQIDCGDTPWEHFYTNSCIQYDRAPGVYLMFPSRFVPDRTPNLDWPKNGISDIVLLSSRDGLKFDRSFMEAFIRPGLDEDNWHERSLFISRGILQTSPTEMSLYGREHSSLPTVHYTRFALRTDGFVSVNAGYEGGEFVTEPLLFEGEDLELNFSASAVGSVRVEILNEQGHPVPGFGLEACPEILGDSVARTVRWSDENRLEALVGQPIRLRFVLKDADLYSFKFNA